jgi:hypothetical protein
MRRAFVLIAVLVVAMALSVAVAGRAAARTPTPPATPWPTSTPTPIAMRLSPDLAYFDINLWDNGRQDWQSKIVAKIGDVVCGTETQEPISPVDSGMVEHFVNVQSDALVAGCGKPGATITFFVDGRKVDRMAEWSQEQNKQIALTEGPRWMPSSFVSLTLLVGPPFARVEGNADPQLVVNGRVVPFIGDTACGYQENPWQGEAPPYGYGVVVYSGELQPGCGYEGAQITFKLLDEQRNELAVSQQKGVWHTWDGTASTFQSLDLTMVPIADISIGTTGTGDSQNGGGTPSGIVTLGLALAGVATLGAGAALRKRAGH